MRVLKLRATEIRDKLRDFFAEHGVWFPSGHQSHDEILLRLRRAMKSGLSDYVVAIDDCAGNKMVGFAGSQIEITVTKGGVPTVTITDFYVLPEYEAVKTLLLNRIVRMAITEDAHVLRAIVPVDLVPFFQGELFYQPLDNCLMERTLPSTRYKTMPKKPRERQLEES